MNPNTPYPEIESAILYLAGYDDDRARDKNGVGFSAFHVDFGHKLAEQINDDCPLSPRQAAAALNMLKYYTRTQLSGWKLPDKIEAPTDDKPAAPPPISFTVSGADILISFAKKPSPETLDKVRGLPERRWNPDLSGKPWTVPVQYAANVIDLFPEAANALKDLAPADSKPVQPLTRSTAGQSLQPAVVISKVNGDVRVEFPRYEGRRELVDSLKALIPSGDRKWLSEKPGKPWRVAAVHTIDLLAAFPGAQVAPEVQALADSMRTLASMSNQASSEFEVPGLHGELYPFQRAGVQFVDTAKGRAIIADEMGLGKTVQGVAYLQLHTAKRPALIVCPASLKTVWYRHLIAWLSTGEKIATLEGQKSYDPALTGATVFIINYDILAHWVDRLQALNVQVLILDEAHYCFPGDTMITTNNGKKSISSIKIGDMVLSCDLSRNALQYNRVKAVMKRPAPDQLAEISYSDKKLVCTIDHPVYTEEDDYAEAITVSGKTMRMVQDNICVPVTGEKEKRQAPFLRNYLCSQMENGTTGTQRTITRNNKKSSTSYQRKQAPGRKPENENKQSNEQPGNTGENETKANWQNIPGARRQPKKNSATTKNAGSIRMDSSLARISSSTNTGKRSIRERAKLLQGGYSKSGTETSNRNRRQDSQNETLEIIGSPQNGDFKLVRVDSVTLHQRTNRQRFEQLCSDGYVYNIEVENTNNYFANGVLVHNCKNRKAQRSQAVNTLTESIPCVIPLTGTPALNRPAELFPLLHMVDPKAWNNFFSFGMRYCAGQQVQAGRRLVWDFSGASNLDELHEKVKPYMIRRTKAQVLKELPPKRRAIVPITFDKKYMDEYQAAVNMVLESDEPAAQLRYFEVAKQAAVKGKMSAALDWIENFIEQEKLVVFCTHIAPVEQIMAKFGKQAVKVSGDVSMDKRQEAVDRFQNDPAVRLFVGIYPKAAGVGITLTAASNVAFLELAWTPGDVTQAEDRAHRIGQRDSVTAWYLVATDTVDEEIAGMLNEKAKILDRMIDGITGADALVDTSPQTSILDALVNKLKENK